MSTKNGKGSYRSLLFALRRFENLSDDQTENALIEELKEFRDVAYLISSGGVEQKQFVHSMWRTLSHVKSHSQVALSILDVLVEICSAPESERILNHLQKLTPQVSNVLLGAVEEFEQVAALKVLQALTYGIKIQLPDSFVAPLMSFLIDFSKPGTESTIIQLSLSVLANLLHRNKAVLFSLIQTVKVKDFMNDLLSVQSNISCKLEVSKLMFLLEDFIHEKPDDVEVSSFLRVSFGTIMQSARSKNTSHLRHCVSFFADLVNENKINVASLGQPWFFEIVEKVINLLGDLDNSDPDCAMLLFKFLRVFIKMEIPSFSNFHHNIMKHGIAWTIAQQRKATEVIITMSCVLESQIQSQSNQGNGMTVDELISVFIPLLSETSNTRSDSCFLIGLLNFLSTVLEVELYNIVLKEYLEKETIEHLLESASNVDIQNNFNASDPVVQMYVHLIIFVNKVMTCCNSSWKNFYTCLLQEQKLVTVLAGALVYGSRDLKGKVLSIIASDEFPRDSLDLLSKSLAECGSGRPLPFSWDDSKELQFSPKLASSYADVSKLIRNINNSINSEELQHISSSQVMQLYNYKEQVNSDYQKSLVSSLSHASGEITLLQEELFIANQITSQLQQEVNCLRKTLDDVGKENKVTLKVLEETKHDMSNLKNRLIQEQSNSQMQIQKLKESSEIYEKELINATSQIKCLKGQLVEKADSLNTILEEYNELKEENGKLNIEVKSRTEDLERLGSELKSKVVQLESQVVLLEQDKKAKEREIIELQRIRDTVFELTGGRKKFS